MKNKILSIADFSFDLRRLLLYSMLSFIIVFLASCDKNSVEEVKNETSLELRHRLLDGFETPTLCEPIKICQIDNCTSRQDDAFREAIEIMNNISGTSLRFEIIECDFQNTADITVECVGALAGCVAGGVNEDLNRITVGDSGLLTGLSDCCPEVLNFTSDQLNCLKLNIMLHELMHIVGFSHTNDKSKGSHISGTASWDDNSVINTHLPGEGIEIYCESLFRETCGLSEGDIAAIQQLYPETTSCDCPEVPCDCPELFDEVDECECQRLAGVQDCDCEYAQIPPNFDIIFNGPICFGDIVRFSLNPIPSWQELNVTSWTVSGSMNTMGGGGNSLVAEANSSGLATICATAINSCGLERQICTNVNVQSESNCNGGGDIPNPK